MCLLQEAGVGPEATWATTQDVEAVGSSWSVSSSLASTGPYHGVLQGRFGCPSSLEFQPEFKPELALVL